MDDDVRVLDEVISWLADAAVVESSAEQRAVARATLSRLQAMLVAQRQELAQLRSRTGEMHSESVRMRTESARLRSESAQLRQGSAQLREERNQAREEADRLRSALTSRVIIEQAKGMIAARCDVDIDTAFERLRRHARDHNARIHDVAEAVVQLGLQV